MKASNSSSDTWPAIEALRATAEHDFWLAPAQSVTAARAACVAARDCSPRCRADCALTLSAALNALGCFAEAAETLETLADAFPIKTQADQAAWYHSERVVAHTYRGALDTASVALAQARATLIDRDAPLAHARCERAEGILRLEQNNYTEAAEMLQRAIRAYEHLGREGDAALASYDLALTLRFGDPQAALQQIALARRKFDREEAALHQARCDYVEALIDYELNRYADSVALLQGAWPVFEQAGLAFLVGLCDLGQGPGHHRLNHDDEALAAYRRAQPIFVTLNLPGYALLCDFNIAISLVALNRYHEALEIYQRVAEAAQAEGRLMRAARCYTNMGLCHDKLGKYATALTLHDRAYQTFRETGNLVHAALAEENLAGTWRCLGRPTEALHHYTAARAVLAEHKLPVYVARCDTHLADLHLALNQYEEALTCLMQARAIYEQQGMRIHAATCERELARGLIGIGTPERLAEAIERLTCARRTLIAQNLMVDAAACDVASGEAYLVQHQAVDAAQSFAAALPVLDPAFPDEAWRAHYGLGQCAWLAGDAARALQAWLAALDCIHRVRTRLHTEQLSGGFFAAHQPLYTATLDLALEIGEGEAALLVVEASKTQTFASWQQPHAGQATGDHYTHQLIERETSLRRDIDVLRSQLRVLQPDVAGPVLRGATELSASPSAALTRLTQLSAEYEQVIEQLRLARPQAFLEASQLFSDCGVSGHHESGLAAAVGVSGVRCTRRRADDLLSGCAPARCSQTSAYALRSDGATPMHRSGSRLSRINLSSHAARPASLDFDRTNLSAASLSNLDPTGSARPER